MAGKSEFRCDGSDLILKVFAPLLGDTGSDRCARESRQVCKDTVLWVHTELEVDWSRVHHRSQDTEQLCHRGAPRPSLFPPPPPPCA